MRMCRPGILAVTLLILMASYATALDKETRRWLQRSPVIRKIVVEGNQRISDSDIKGRMYSKERTFWSALRGDRRSRLQRETLARDTLEIKYLYFKNGFLGVEVRERFEMNEKDSSVVVNVSIEEGSQFHYGNKTLAGDYPHGFTFQFNKIVDQLKPGKPINPLEIQQTIFDMKAYMANRGYPYASVNYTVDTGDCDNGCPIIYDIKSDSAVTFGNVNIDGSTKYPEYVASRELKVREGQTYRRADILDSQRRLYESGYFSSFTLTQADTLRDRLRPDFTLRLRERKPYFLTTTTGAVGQSELRDLLWVFTLGGGKRNLAGSRRLEGSMDYYFSVGSDTRLIRHIYRLKFTEPWFLDIRMPLILGGEYRPRVQSEYQEDNYDIETWKISVSTRKNFGRAVKTELGLEYESVNITGIDDEKIPLIKQEEGTSNRRKLYYTFRRDSRDNLFIPQTGSVGEISVEHVGGFLGGDDNFRKVRASWSRYQVLWPGWISATRLRGGWVGEFGKSGVVPAEDRFYLGGANTIRGFKEKSLGPLADGTALGARYSVVINQEFRWKTIQVLQKLPLLGKLFETLPLWQSVFFDMGNVFDKFDNIRLDQYAYSYGTGLQLVSPAGPIRVDYARRIGTDRYEVDDRWHFTILYAF